MRILALDWGEVRVGAAVSDPDGKIAFPLDKNIDARNAVTEIKKIVQELRVEKIIVGMPKSLAGEQSLSSQKVENFVQSLKKNVPCDFETVDERFTSVEAGKKLTSMGFSEQQQRSIKDNVAAQIMLQQYLDTK
jgi:putative Holliday junction resolvase